MDKQANASDMTVRKDANRTENRVSRLAVEQMEPRVAPMVSGGGLRLPGPSGLNMPLDADGDVLA